MARWLVVLVVLLGGALLMDQWFGDSGEGADASAKSLGTALKASMSEGAEKSVGGKSAAAEADRPRRPGKARPASRPSPERKLDRVFGEAQALLGDGRRAEAVSLLRAELRAAESAADRGRLGLHLAMLAPGASAGKRQLLAQALATRQVLGSQYDKVGEMLAELNRSRPASLVEGARTASYTVRPNDSLWKLCYREFPEAFGVQLEVGLLKLVNGLSGDTLRVGQRLVVPLEPVRLTVDRQQRGLVAWMGDIPVASYRIGLGKDGSTPAGDFLIQVKQENPAWTYRNETIPFGDERNILGTRWLGFEDHPGVTGYGIHGTARPETIGQDESMGCVRMRNDEVEELFELVPRGTLVSIP